MVYRWSGVEGDLRKRFDVGRNIGDRSQPSHVGPVLPQSQQAGYFANN